MIPPSPLGFGVIYGRPQKENREKAVHRMLVKLTPGHENVEIGSKGARVDHFVVLLRIEWSSEQNVFAQRQILNPVETWKKLMSVATLHVLNHLFGQLKVCCHIQCFESSFWTGMG